VCYWQIWHNFTGDNESYKLSKGYLNALICKFCALSKENSETYDISHQALPSYQRAQNSPVFGPPCTCS